MKVSPWLTLIVLALLLAIPFVFGEIMLTSLHKLHLNPGTAGLVMIGIFAGGVVNIPLRRFPNRGDGVAHPLAAFGLEKVWPRLGRETNETVIAVNLGGCLIPLGIVVYELTYILDGGAELIWACAMAVAANVAICYLVARPMEGIGIVLPGFVPPLAAAASAYVLAPEVAAPVAFVAGVLGPLIGADLMHLKEIRDQAVGVASIGGAGTFDGIVLSGIIAAYLV